MRGGHAHSGPAPDPAALRRERSTDAAGWTTLFGERTGDAPEWPVELAEPSVAEMSMWAREWRRPQAKMWERNGQESEVALYVRTFIDAGGRDASANMRTLVVRQQETLGISATGLARHRWKIEPAAESEGTEAPVPRAGRSARDRFEVVQGGKAA